MVRRGAWGDAEGLASCLVPHDELLVGGALAIGLLEVALVIGRCACGDDTPTAVEPLHLGAYHGGCRQCHLAAHVPKLLDGDLSEVGGTADGDEVKLGGRCAVTRHGDGSTRSLGLVVAECGLGAILAQLRVTRHEEGCELGECR